MKQSAKSIAFVALYIEDNLMVRDSEARDEEVGLLQRMS